MQSYANRLKNGSIGCQSVPIGCDSVTNDAKRVSHQLSCNHL